MQVEKIEYQKAYVELYEIIKALPEEEQEKIPKILLKNLKDNMSKEYKFEIDTERDILNQNYKIETKALFVELYERYLAPKEEKNFWDKYDKICNNMIEEKKLKLYDTENIFKNKKQDKERSIKMKKWILIVLLFTGCSVEHQAQEGGVQTQVKVTARMLL